MARRRPAPALNTPADDFQRAAAEAETKAGKRMWFEMSPSEQTRAIYAQLRQIDADRAVAMAFSPGRPGAIGWPERPSDVRHRADHPSGIVTLTLNRWHGVQLVEAVHVMRHAGHTSPASRH